MTSITNLIITMALTFCSNTNFSKYAVVNSCYYKDIDTCAEYEKMKITINIYEEKQTIHSFGASDCWTTKFYGKWSDDSKKNIMADYLFSMDTMANGSPKGIALSQWRFNIGAGSYEQGAASGIPEDWRREECFLTADGSYDWTKQQGAQWFLRAARARNVQYTTGFAISAPVYMTADRKAHGAGGKTFNIHPGKMADYATFLSTVSAHFNFDYLSPFNEPQWNWGGANASQEGTAATNTEIAALTRLLGPKLQSNAANTRIVLGEAAQLNFITDTYGGDRGDQIYDWFNSASPNYVGNVPNVEKIISGHSYFTTCPDSNLIKTRVDLNNRRNVINPYLNIWQSEFCVLGDICGSYNGNIRNTGIDYGLYVAKIIHHDLVMADVSSWSWWLAMSAGDYNDGLVYINDPSGNINGNNTKTDGIVLDSKQLWCMGNFSRFVRPGMKRFAATINGINDVAAANSLMVSGYKDPATKKIVLVIINMSNNSKKFTLDGLGTAINIVGNRFDTYSTTATKSLARSVTPADNISVEGKSVITLVGSYN